MWCTYSPMTVPNRGITVTHIRHLAQRGSDTMAIPLPSSNLTRLGLNDRDPLLVLFPRSWETARWSHVVFRFDRFPFDKVTAIDVHIREPTLRTLAWIDDRLILDAVINDTLGGRRRFERLFIPCQGARTTLGIAFLEQKNDRWDEAVVVRASRLVRVFPLIQINETLWLAGRPSAEDRWWGRVRHIGNIPGNVALFRSTTKKQWSSMSRH